MPTDDNGNVIENEAEEVTQQTEETIVEEGETSTEETSTTDEEQPVEEQQTDESQADGSDGNGDGSGDGTGDGSGNGDEVTEEVDPVVNDTDAPTPVDTPVDTTETPADETLVENETTNNETVVDDITDTTNTTETEVPVNDATPSDKPEETVETEVPANEGAETDQESLDRLETYRQHLVDSGMNWASNLTPEQMLVMYDVASNAASQYNINLEELNASQIYTVLHEQGDAIWNGLPEDVQNQIRESAEQWFAEHPDEMPTGETPTTDVETPTEEQPVEEQPTEEQPTEEQTEQPSDTPSEEPTGETDNTTNGEDEKDDKGGKVHAFIQALIDKCVEHGIDVPGIAKNIGIDLAAYGFVVHTKEELEQQNEAEGETPTEEQSTEETPATEEEIPTEETTETEQKIDFDGISCAEHPYPDTNTEVVADILVRNHSEYGEFGDIYAESTESLTDKTAEEVVSTGAKAVDDEYKKAVERRLDYVRNGSYYVSQPQFDEEGNMLTNEDGTPVYESVVNSDASITHIPHGASVEQYKEQVEIFKSKHTQSVVYTDDELNAMDENDRAMILSYENKLRTEYSKEHNIIINDDYTMIDVSMFQDSEESIFGPAIESANDNYEQNCAVMIENKKAEYEEKVAALENSTEVSAETEQHVTSEESVDDKNVQVEQTENVSQVTDDNQDTKQNAALDEFNSYMASSSFVDRCKLLTEEEQNMIGHIGSETSKKQAVDTITNERVKKLAEELGSDYIEMSDNYVNGILPDNEQEAEV